jgi:hypothetical protein
MFSCFAHPDPFREVPRAPGAVLMIYAPEPILGGAKGAGSPMHDLRSRTCFGRYRGRRVPFSCFALPTRFGRHRGRRVSFLCFPIRNSFSAVPRAPIPFSCFALLEPFLAVRRAPHPVFMFCAPGPILGGTEGTGYRFHVLRARSHFRLYRGPQFPFSFFAVPKRFSTVATKRGPVFIFCAHVTVCGGTEGVGSRFHVLRSWTRFRRY